MKNKTHMRADRYRRMIQAYGGFCGPATLAAIEDVIPSELYDQLTGTQLGMIMRAVNESFHRGKVEGAAEEKERMGVATL